MAQAESEGIIQYVAFTSFVHPSFWHTLTEMKLEVDKLNQDTKQIFGRYNGRCDIGAVFEVDGTSFNQSPQTEQFHETITGTIVNKNTIEEFKSIDKAALLNSVGEMIWANIKNRSWIEKPNNLLNFLILSFADLKKFHYYFWFAFPCPSQPTVFIKQNSTITSEFDGKQLEAIAQGHKAQDPAQRCYFAISKGPQLVVKPLSEVLSVAIVQTDVNRILTENYFGFLDPSNSENPGWPLRMFLAALVELCSGLNGADVNIIALRHAARGSVEASRIFTVNIPQDVKPTETAGWVGWERNDRGNFGPKLANMSASMDPVKLADASSDLNIKLMKWRLVPDLNFGVMKETKCLLLGAGTLGCHVARDLLAWGFRHMTFVDSGKVSYSNPTRQVLFTHRDCLGGGRGKAEAAAANMELILPTVITQGIPLHIPMPGHPIGDALRPETVANIERLCKAIEEHDVIFLLLDTREARWLPTLIAAHYGKIVINAALGFDSYLVIRHGTFGSPSEPQPLASQYVRGTQLGCYFCNDVTAPGNSLKDRTLDQQCTVTRPGVAAIAGALAVEVLVSLLQHPLRVDAPAVSNLSDELEKGLPAVMQGVLGPIPHSIRGFLYSYQTVVPTCVKFKQCIACSDVVVNKYRQEGLDFVLKACESGKYLEEVTGLAELHLTAEMTDILTFSDEDEED